MKKNLTIITILAILSVGLVSCGNEEVGKVEVVSGDVPSSLRKVNEEKQGTLETFSYQTKDYVLGNGKTESKECNVYLPYNYDASKPYNVLYLLHGTDKQSVDHINTWWNRIGMKNVLDNLIAMEAIEPLIVVTPTFYSYGLYGDDTVQNVKELTPTKKYSSENFPFELRNDIIPAVESHFSTYASDTTEAGIQASRDHRAMAGLSNGARITLEGGLLKNFDYISYFGAYSASTSAKNILEALDSAPYKNLPLRGFYLGSGIYDFAYNGQKKMYQELKKYARFKDAKFFKVDFGYHSARSWRVSLYDSLQFMFKGASL